MLEKDTKGVYGLIEEFNRDEEVKIGVVGPGGLPVFNTDITVPQEIFTAEKEASIESANEFIVFKPLQNESRCHPCHNPQDKIRGMVVVKASLVKMHSDLRETVWRMIYFAAVLILLSAAFVVVTLRKIILKPLKILTDETAILKSGNFNHRINLKRDDEIGTLISCFNDMAQSIEESHENLENLVRQRTEELQVIAEMSPEVFRGDITHKEIIEKFLNAITALLGYKYSAICIIDKETKLFLQEFRKGINDCICASEMSLASDHPYIKTIIEARPVIKESFEVKLPDEYGRIAIIPILSLQKMRCREIIKCGKEACPAFNNPDERCWLIGDTFCRSPYAVVGTEKIYGCLHCAAFPILGVLMAGGKVDITDTSLYSLEILASELASAIENQQLIDTKKEEISDLIILHNTSIELRNLNLPVLTQAIASSATVFTDMDASILWIIGEDGRLYPEAVSNIEKEILPQSLSIEETFIGRAISENRPVETIKIQDVKCLDDIFKRYGFLYAVSVPVGTKDSMHGCLTLFKSKASFMDVSKKTVIQIFAIQAAYAIDLANLYNRLKIENEFSDLIFNNMITGIMVIDKDGRIKRLNQAGSEILKIPHEVAVRHLKDISPQWSDLLITDVSSLGREIEVNAIPIGFHSSPIVDTNGDDTGTIVVFRELTEIKKLQAEIKKKHQFEAMGKVIAGVAHEIRNPLFGISGIAQILERELISTSQQSLLSVMLKEIHRIKNILDELLLYSRPSALNIISVDMDTFIERIKYYVSAKSSAIAFNLRVQPSIIIRADTDKMIQVFMNLIDNAIGADSKEINIIVDRKDNKVRVTVKDDGNGIKKENMDKLFDPFFTTKKEGTGLGLPICKKIIEDHGWGIEVQSAEGKGTEVTLTF